MTTWPRPPLTPLSQISPIVIWSPLRKKQCLIVAPRHHIMTQHCQKLCLCGNLVDLKSNGRCVTEPDSSASSSCYTRFVTPEIVLLLCCNVIMGEYHGYHQIPSTAAFSSAPYCTTKRLDWTHWDILREHSGITVAKICDWNSLQLVKLNFHLNLLFIIF